MSLACMTWVLTHSDERLGRRLVLLVLADYAHDDGTRAFPSVDTMAEKARMSRSQVQRVLRQLVESGAITKTGTTGTGTVIYQVQMGGPQYATPGPQTRSGGAANPPSATAEMRPDPELEPPLEQPPPLATLAAPTGQLLDFASYRGKKVKAEQARLVLDIIAAWNRLAGRRIVATPDRQRLVLRQVQDNPDLELADHEHLIRHLLANPYGDREQPVLNQLYGPKAFPVQREKAEAGPTEGDAERVLRVAREAGA